MVEPHGLRLDGKRQAMCCPGKPRENHGFVEIGAVLRKILLVLGKKTGGGEGLVRDKLPFMGPQIVLDSWAKLTHTARIEK